MIKGQLVRHVFTNRYYKVLKVYMLTAKVETVDRSYSVRVYLDSLTIVDPLDVILGSCDV